MKNNNSTRHVSRTGDLVGNNVVNSEHEDLGSIEEIVIDKTNGRVSYAVLSFGGFLGMGDKLFAIPWEALTLDKEDDTFVLDVDKKTLENAKGFDKDNWPNIADANWETEVYEYYNVTPYWQDL